MLSAVARGQFSTRSRRVVQADQPISGATHSNASAVAIRRPRWGSFGWMGVVLALLFAGCNDSAPPAAGGKAPAAGGTGTATTSTTVGPNDAVKDRQCADLLSSIHSIFLLDNMPVPAKVADGVAMLNRWDRTCGSSGPGSEATYPTPSQLDEQFHDRLTEAEQGRLLRKTFNERDGRSIRDALLLKAMSNAARGASTSEQMQIQHVFDYVIESLELTAEHPNGLPLPLYDLLVWGQGTAADRAWCFVELLRVLKIDAVVLAAPQTADDETDDWGPQRRMLVGVLHGGEVLLFDPHLGLGLQAPGADGKPQPLTMSAAMDKPELLQSYAGDEQHPYPITPEWLKSAQILITGNTSLWSERMAVLQGIYVGATALTVSDPLFDRDGRSGLLTRVIQWPGESWTADRVQVWSYPESQLEGHDELSAQHQQTLARLQELWPTPVEMEFVKKDKETNAVFRTSYRFLNARLAHLQGESEKAVRNYISIQITVPKPNEQLPTNVPEEVRRSANYDSYVRAFRVHKQTGEEAAYWVGVAKSQEQTADATRVTESKFTLYLKNYAEGLYVPQAHLHLAQIAAAQSKFAVAHEHLNLIPEDHVLADSARYWKRIWPQPQSPSSGDKPAQTKPETPDAGNKPAGDSQPASENPTDDKAAAPPATKQN